MRILLLTQDLTAKGGVSNFFRILHDKFTLPVTCFIVGSRIQQGNFLTDLHRFFYDYFKFIQVLSSYSLIHINTSMRLKSLGRDGLFLIIAKIAHKKVLVFIHGWDAEVSQGIEKYFLWLYKAVFFRADAFIVLSQEFKSTLVSWGYSKAVFLLSGIVDETQFDHVNEKFIKKKPGKSVRILFLARTEKAKGVFLAIQIYQILKSQYPHLSLVIAGDGSDYHNAVNFARTLKLQDIQFAGFVTGATKKRIFSSADIYLLPTFYGEGMPLSVLEAMAFGLPVVTRPVGGIKDFFQHGKMGYLVQELDGKIFVPYLEKLINDPSRRVQMGLYNTRYVKKNCVIPKVLAKIEDIYRTLTMITC